MRIPRSLLMLLAPGLLGAENLANTASQLKEIAARADSWAPYFESLERLATGISFSVIVLGGAATFIALANRGWTKWITAFITFLIAVLTGYKFQVLHADQESFGAIAVAIRHIVQQIDDHVTEYNKAVQIERDDHRELREDAASTYSDLFKRDLEIIQRIDDRAMKLNTTIMVARKITAAAGWPGPTTVYASPLPQSRPAPKPPANSYVGIGTGTCDSVYGAREYSRFDGRRRIALQVEPGAAPERLDALINAIDSSAVDQWSNLTKEPNSRFAIHTTQVTLNKYLAQGTYLKVKSEGRPAPRFSASTAVRPGVQGRVEVGAAEERRGMDGAFVFVFEVSYQGDAVQVRLVEIKTYDDSSMGSTRWSFDVLVNNQRAFAVPLRRLEDSAKPTTCRVLPDENMQGTARLARPGAGFELRIHGYKPKDY